MRTSFKMVCLLLVLVLFVPMGCSSKQEQAQAEVVGVMNNFADVLAGVKSNTDFVDAKPKLERLGAQMKDARHAWFKLRDATDAKEQARLDKELEAQLKPVGERFEKEMSRLTKIGVSPLDVASAMGNSMGGLTGY